MAHRSVRVTHPFHPLRGQALLVLHYGVGRDRDALVLQSEDGRALRMPAAWTDLRAPDEYVALSAAGVCFRVPDLLQLSGLVSHLMQELSR